MKVLVVDDELHLRLFIATVFETAGYEVETARNGSEGFEKALAFRPDLVVLDLMMPREGGIKLFRNLRLHDELSTVPLFVVSAIAGETFGHSLTMLRAGEQKDIAAPDRYFQKPPKPELLLEAAVAVLNGQDCGEG